MKPLSEYVPPADIHEAATRILSFDDINEQHVEKLRAVLYMVAGDVDSRRAEIDAEIERRQKTQPEVKTKGY